jgi:hypothetical protein
MPLTWRITEVSNPSESPRPPAFEAAAAARQLHDPCALALAESGRHDLHALAGARSLAARPDPRSVHSPWVRREGVEPSRLAARASETRVAACYTTSARSGWRGLNPRPSPWRGDALPAELHPPVSGRSGATARSRTGTFCLPCRRSYQLSYGGIRTTSLLPDSNRQPSRYRRAALTSCAKEARGERHAARRVKVPRYDPASGPPRAVRCARRESNPQHPASRAGLSASWSTSTMASP